jgi:hypothetical protein
VDAVNAEGSYGQWRYAIVKKTTDVADTITKVAGSLTLDAVRQ